MKFKIHIILIYIISSGFAQGQNSIQGVILDESTLEPLQFATIGAINQPYGCYSDTTGLFTLHFSNYEDSLKISYMGYESIYSTVNNLNNNSRILLESSSIQLKEVVVTSAKTKFKKLDVGYFSKKRRSVLASSYPKNSIAIYIPFPDQGNRVILKSIRFTYDLIKNSINYTMRISILNVKTNGEPGDHILTENVDLSKSNPRPKLLIAEVDISRYNLSMPDNGVIVALEWIMDTPPKGRNIYQKQYGPYIGLIKTTDLHTHWLGSYNQLEWQKKQTRATLSIGFIVHNYTDR